MSNQRVTPKAASAPTSPTSPTVFEKYDKDNPPAGWSYVNYKNMPGGGFQCPGCGATEDGADVNGHNC